MDARARHAMAAERWSGSTQFSSALGTDRPTASSPPFKISPPRGPLSLGRRGPISSALALSRVGASARRRVAAVVGPASLVSSATENMVQVFVRDNDINSALRVLKRKMQREGTFREMKRRRSYEKPSERRVREKAEAIRRTRKVLRKRMEREGY
jgi:small subunit ribosomal protein S21